MEDTTMEVLGGVKKVTNAEILELKSRFEKIGITSYPSRMLNWFYDNPLDHNSIKQTWYCRNRVRANYEILKQLLDKLESLNDEKLTN